MSIIKLGPLETVTSLAVTTTAGQTLEKEDFQSTSISALSTSLASTFVDKPHVELNIAQKYVDSLSDSQLAEMVERLTNKSEDMTFLTVNLEDMKENGYVQPTQVPQNGGQPTQAPQNSAQPTMPTMPPVGNNQDNRQPAQPTQPTQPTEPPRQRR